MSRCLLVNVYFLLISGVMYREGRGVEQNFLDAGRWYTKAAYQGFAEAQYDLGVMYDQGNKISCIPIIHVCVCVWS